MTLPDVGKHQAILVNLYNAKREASRPPYLLIFKNLFIMLTTKIVVPTYFPKSEIKENGPSVAIMTVTKHIAEYWLSTYNTNNRPLNNSNLEFICHQMTSGQWVSMNGDTVSFLLDGRLNDSQHRLAAIAKTGIPQQCIVVVGLPLKAFKAKDTGKKRTGGDVLAIEGYKHYNNLASIARFIISHKKGAISKAAQGGSGKAATMVSNTDISEFVAKNKARIEKCCEYATKLWFSGDKLVAIKWLGGLCFLLGEKDVKKADSFLFRLATGSDIEHGTTMYQLKKKLLSAALSDVKKIPARTKLAFIIKTWNFERLGKDRTQLKFSPSRGEKFPSII